MDKERRIDKYESIINYLVSSVRPNIKEDLKQDLYMLTWKILNSKIKPKDLDSYIFIALRNERNRLLKKPLYQSSLSLNESINSETEHELIDFIVDEKYNRDSLDLHMDLEKIISNNLSAFAGQVICEYYYQNLKEKEIAEKHGVTQQYISKTLRKALRKIQSLL